MNPSEALELQLRTRMYWTNGDGSHYLHHVLGKCPPGHPLTRNPPPIDAELERGARLIARLVDEAETYCVAAPICQILQHGLTTFPAETALHAPDLPTPSGFIVFETPITTQPLHGETFDVVTAIGWSQVSPASINVAFFAVHPNVPPLIGLTNWNFGWTCQDAVDFTAHPEDGVTVYDLDAYDPDAARERLPNFCLFLSALLFSRQRLAVTTHERPYRAARKRLAPWRPEPVVRVIALRARDYEPSAEPSGGPVDWHCRWITRGHWRNQPCGPNRSVVRPVWVAPYVKGPADKPLKNPRASVFAVVR